MLSSVKLGINRPNSGADHRQRGTQASQHDGDQRTFKTCKQYPNLDNGDRDAGERRPQAEKEKDPRDSANQEWKARRPARRLHEVHGSGVEQNRARQNPLKQKTEAGPALGEC